MLRRVANLFRWGLLALGLPLLVLWPVSYFRGVRVDFPYSGGGYGTVAANRGAGILFLAQGDVSPVLFEIEMVAPDPGLPAPLLIPAWDRFTMSNPSGQSFTFTQLRLPLWLVVVACLAWPVTSFVIARRRRGTRGFEVETKQLEVSS